MPRLPESIHAFALTQRGHGDASHLATGYRVRDYADDLAAFFDALHLQAAIIAGHSMGSSVAPRFAINHPERMLGLVLVSPRASMQDRPGLLELWNSTISKLTDPIDPGFVRSFEHLFIRPVPEAFRKTVFQDALKVPAHVWRGSFQAALEDDLLQRTDKIKVPSLLVWGAEDASSPQSDRDAIMAAIMGSRRIIYPGVGHWPHAEAPDRFATDLVAFIEEHAK